MYYKQQLTFSASERTTLVNSITTMSTHFNEGCLSFSICFFTIVSNAMSGVNKPVLNNTQTHVFHHKISRDFHKTSKVFSLSMSLALFCSTIPFCHRQSSTVSTDKLLVKATARFLYSLVDFPDIPPSTGDI